jgi:endogenous inhibitor of DNA gyrase (YacG/DUF329 family)
LTVSERTVPAKVKCPTCRKEVSWEHNPHRPFCSERCQLIDLGAWAQAFPRKRWISIPTRKMPMMKKDAGELWLAQER